MTIKIDEETGLPELRAGEFWRVGSEISYANQFTEPGKYIVFPVVELRRKRMLGSTVIARRDVEYIPAHALDSLARKVGVE